MYHSATLPFLASLLLLVLRAAVSRAAKNVTIDDTYVGPGATIQLFPAAAWSHGAACASGCADPTKAYNGTWQDITYDAPAANSTAPLVPYYMSITFNGTAIYAYTIVVPNYVSAIVNCTIDGRHASLFSSAPLQPEGFVYNVPMCAIENLTDGAHILEISATGDQSSLILFDYAVYTVEDDSSSSTSSSAPTSTATASTATITIDDAYVGSDAVIEYYPSTVWSKGTACSTCPDPAKAYNGTWQDITYDPTQPFASGRSEPVTMTISFTGTGITAYTISVPEFSGSIVNYSIDGNTFQQYNNPNTGSDFVYNVPMASFSGLDNGSHVLFFSAGNLPETSILLFDYATITQDIPSNSSGGGGGSPSGSGSGSNGGDGSSGAGGGSGSDTSHQSHIGAIVGGVVGGLGGLAVIGALVFFFLRRKTSSSHMNWDSEKPATEAVPYGHIESLPIDHTAQSSSGLSPSVIDAPATEVPTTLFGDARDHRPNRVATMTAAQRQALLNQRMEEKVATMQQLQRGSAPGTAVSPTLRSVSPPASSVAGSEIPSEWQQQIQSLQAEVTQLHTLMSSNWARGLTDEPPPEYMATGN